MDVKEIKWQRLDWIRLAQMLISSSSLWIQQRTFGSQKGGELLDWSTHG